MKKTIIAVNVLICIIVSFCLSACQSTKIEDLYTQQEIDLAGKIYEFVSNHVCEDDSYLTILSLHVQDGCFLELLYTTEGYYKSKKSNNGMRSLGFPTSFCYEVNTEGVTDKKYSGSLGSFDGAIENTSWYVDGTQEDNMADLYDFARAVIRECES